MHLYLNTHEKTKQNVRSTIHEEASVGTIDDIQKRPVGYVSIVSLSSTIPTDNVSTTRPKFGISSKSQQRTIDFGRRIEMRISFYENSF